MTSAVFHGLLLSHHGSKLLGCLGGPLLERHVASPSASISTLSPRDTALPLSLVHSLISLHESSRESLQPSLLLPPAPLRAFQQRLVLEWWESLGPALPTDGRPVGLYQSRTDAALAAARRLSLLPALSGSDLWVCHPPGMRFPGTPAVPTSCHPGTPARLAGPRTTSPNGGQIGQQTCLIRLTLNFSRRL